jgi:DNA-3-methyladenine glycosylase I
VTDMDNPRVRCQWPGSDPLYIEYHDTEWGVALHDDRRLFEFLVLDGFQAGLNWITILRKRGAFREAFERFVPEKVADFSEARINQLMLEKGIVRNRAKITAAVINARQLLEVQAGFGSFDGYIWQFVDGRPLVNTWRSESQIPAETPVSQAMSRDLRQRGFKFVGPTICYAFMQAAGLVNDHVLGCFRYHELAMAK